MIYLRLLRSIAYTLLCLHLLHILVHKLFTCLPNSLSGCLNLQRNTFSPSHYHLFLKHIDTVAIFVPLLPCLPDHCLNSVSDSLSLNFAPHIHLIILISALCNAWWLVWNNGGWGLENMEKSQFASGQGKVKENVWCVCVCVCMCVCGYRILAVKRIWSARCPTLPSHSTSWPSCGYSATRLRRDFPTGSFSFSMIRRRWRLNES